MKRSGSRKRLYTILGLLSLLYMFVGWFLSSGTVDYYCPSAECPYNIVNDPTAVTVR